jgi:phospholipase/lecithinase/hemolysin
MCGTDMAGRNGGAQGCRSSTSLCSRDPNFTFDNLTAISVTPSSHAHVIVDLNTMNTATAAGSIRLFDDGVHPLTVRAGDINLGINYISALHMASVTMTIIMICLLVCAYRRLS